MRSKISTLASTAIPIESTMPASPGSVSVASSIASPPRVNSTYRPERRDRQHARQPVVADHDQDHSAVPTRPAMMPLRWSRYPRLAPTWRSSTILSGIGSAPAFSVSARSCASCSVLPPSVIWPFRPIRL